MGFFGNRPDLSGVDMVTAVGSVVLANPVMTASGTAGHGAELGAYVDLSGLGAVVVKSLCVQPWAGNPAPRVHETPAGMINSVGLQGPGLERWANDELPALLAADAKIVVSIWGRSVDEYAAAAELCAGLPEEVVAVEVNVSCPNVEDRHKMFAHSVDSTRAVLEATSVARRPRWAKLSPNVTDIVEIAAAAKSGGAEAVTLINTVMGMVIDVDSAAPVLGSGGGGLSGQAIGPVAVRAVYDVYAAGLDLPIVGVGGVASAQQAIQLLMAGATAVQIGTASFADPSATEVVLGDLAKWCRRHGVGSAQDLVGVAHR